MTDMQGGPATEMGATTGESVNLNAAVDPGSNDTNDQTAGAFDAGAEGALQPTEADIARQAMIDRAQIQQTATETFSMIAWFAQAAAISLRYGYQDETQLVASVAAIGEWHSRAVNALVALGQGANGTAPLPTREVLQQDLGQLRTLAQSHLRDLAAYAHSHADLIDAMPEDFPALLAVGRALTETFNATNGALLGIGMVMRARASVG